MENTWKNELTALVKSVGEFSKVNTPVANAIYKLGSAKREGSARSMQKRTS